MPKRKTNTVRDYFKPALSEIFAALLGVTSAGVTVTRKGADTKKHPLADQAVRAASLSFDLTAHG